MSTTDNQIEAPNRNHRHDADDIVYRPAVAADSRFIAGMIELSSDGIASLEWQEESERTPGLSALDIGARQYASAEGDYSYRNCLIAFYESLGFVVTRRAPIVEHPGIRASGDAVLMETRPR